MMEKLSLVQNKNRTIDKTVILKSRQSQNIDVLCVEKEDGTQLVVLFPRTIQS